MRSRYWFPPLIIYLVAFTIVLWYGLSRLPVNDGVKEYLAYIQNINQGWMFRKTLVNSCVITTYIPALVWKVFGGSQLFIFRLIPALFYPLMPMFTYLIARKYLNIGKSIIATLVVLTSSYFLFFPDMGRVGVGIGFFAGMIWALLNKKTVWTIVFLTLVVLAHYGTAFVAIGVLGLYLLIYLIKYKTILKRYLVAFCLLIILTGVWHFGVAGYSGQTMATVLFQQEKNGYSSSYFLNGEPVSSALIDPMSREPAIQDALLINFNQMETPKKIEVFANWLLVAVVSFGLWRVLRSDNSDRPLKILSLSSFILIIFTIALPWLSVYYGGMRVFFSTSMLFGICFVFGAEKLTKLLHVNFYLLAGVVLVLYGLSTSGLIYNMFGLEKTFPVAISLQG